MPWLIVGTTIGIAGMAFLLPALSDSTGIFESLAVVVCPLLGLGFGFLLDASSPPQGPRPWRPGSP